MPDPTSPASPCVCGKAADATQSDATSVRNVESAQTAVFVFGIYEGLLPFVCKILGWHPFLVFPVRLDNPWWWQVSGAVVVLTLIALEVLERGKQRARARVLGEG